MTQSHPRAAGIIYLACPYTDSDPTIREARFHAANEAAGALIKQGHIVFSPITMTHPLDKVLAGDDTMGSDYWVEFDVAFMEACSEMIVLMIDGWRTSSGVRREIAHFKEQGKPIRYMDPLTGTMAAEH